MFQVFPRFSVGFYASPELNCMKTFDPQCNRFSSTRAKVISNTKAPASLQQASGIEKQKTFIALFIGFYPKTWYSSPIEQRATACILT
jgi:hypothetical protein